MFGNNVVATSGEGENKRNGGVLQHVTIILLHPADNKIAPEQKLGAI